MLRLRESLEPTSSEDVASSPNLPFSNAAVQFRQTGHSCMAQHFGWLKRRSADKTDIDVNDLKVWLI
jgi:hypothetical protein